MRRGVRGHRRRAQDHHAPGRCRGKPRVVRERGRHLLVGQGAVNRTVTGMTKKYKGVAPRMNTLRAEMKLLRAEWSKKLRAKALAKS